MYYIPYGAYFDKKNIVKDGVINPPAESTEAYYFYQITRADNIDKNIVREFFREEEEKQIVFPTEDFFVDEQEDCTIEWIVPNAQKNQMEPIILTLHPRKKSQVMSAYQGQEFGYVLKGRIVIHLGKETHTAKKGDSFYYTADRTHYIFSERGADILWVTSPPSF